MSGRLPLASGVDVLVAIARSPDDRPYDEATRLGLSRVLHDVQRALLMRRRIEAQDAAASLKQAALDALSFGLAVVEQNGRMLFANRAMEDFADAGLGVRLAGGRLTAVVHGDAERLARAMFEAARLRRSGACALAGLHGELCVSVICSPLGARSPFGPAISDGRAMVAVAPLTAGGAVVRNLSGPLFGLSQAEAEIVAALWGGASAREIAARRGVKATTLKTQLEAIFLKTGVGNQRELLRLLGSLPQLLYAP